MTSSDSTARRRCCSATSDGESGISMPFCECLCTASLTNMRINVQSTREPTIQGQEGETNAEGGGRRQGAVERRTRGEGAVGASRATTTGVRGLQIKGVMRSLYCVCPRCHASFTQVEIINLSSGEESGDDDIQTIRHTKSWLTLNVLRSGSTYLFVKRHFKMLFTPSGQWTPWQHAAARHQERATAQLKASQGSTSADAPPPVRTGKYAYLLKFKFSHLFEIIIFIT